MSTLHVQVSDTLYQQARRLAAREGTSVEALVERALSEKVAALLAEDYQRNRLARTGSVSRDDFERLLTRVPDVPPAPEDRLAS